MLVGIMLVWRLGVCKSCLLWFIVPRSVISFLCYWCTLSLLCVPDDPTRTASRSSPPTGIPRFYSYHEIHVCTYIYIYIHIHIHTYTYTYISYTSLSITMCVCVHRCIYIYIHLCVCVYIDVYIYIYIYVHTHT